MYKHIHMYKYSVHVYIQIHMYKYSVHVYIQIHMYKQYIDVITNIDKLHNRHVQKVLHHLDLLKYDKHIYVHSIHFDTYKKLPLL